MIDHIRRVDIDSIVRLARGALVRVRRGGRVGVGECAPLPGRSPDTIDACVRALETARALHDVPASLPAARFALETALADLDAQERGCSVAGVLAAAPHAVLPCSAVVRLGGSSDAGTWKVKIGAGRVEDEVAQLHAVPAGVRLRLDVNRRWDRDTAARALPLLAALSPEWVEEPMPARELVALGPPPVPIALDESVLDDPDATMAALDRGLVRALVLKPAVLGGLAACARWAARARTAGAVPIVSHLFDGPVALAACIELALALAQPGDPAPGLGRHDGLGDWPPVDIPQLRGVTLVSHRPGLGVAP
jgi:o-succinylbenzoate synthase